MQAEFILFLNACVCIKLGFGLQGEVFERDKDGEPSSAGSMRGLMDALPKSITEVLR